MLSTDLYNYTRSEETVTPEEVKRILKNHRVIHDHKDPDKVVRTYVTMGKDVEVRLKAIQHINSRMRQFFGEDTPNLVKTERIKRVAGNQFNMNNVLYKAELNLEAIKHINKVKKARNVLEETRKFAMRVPSVEGNQFTLNFPQQQKGSVFNTEDIGATAAKIAKLKETFDAEVVFDTSIENHQVDAYKEGSKPVIRLNPNKIFQDTVIHEFGHIYIDLLGGVNNLFILDGIEQLRDSEAWEHVKELYPEFDEESEEFQKEVLTTAIGWAGVKYSQKSAFGQWVDRFFEKLKALIGIKPDVAKKLMMDMLTNKLMDTTQGSLSNYVQQQRSKSRQELILQKAKEALVYKIAQYSRYINDENPSRVKYIEGLKKMLTELQKADFQEGLVSFIKRSLDDTKYIQDRLKEIKPEEASIRDYKKLQDHISGYETIYSEITKEIADNPEFKQALSDLQLLEQVNAARGIIDSILEKTYNGMKEITAKKMSSRLGRIEAKYREQYAKDFRKSHDQGKQSNAEYQEAERAYVNSRVAENSFKIKQEEFDNTMSILELAPRDLLGSDAFLMDPKSLNDDLIQYAVEIIERAEYNTSQEFFEEIRNTDKVYQEFAKVKGQQGILLTDTKALYDEMLEDTVDSNGKVVKGSKSGYYVSKYYSKFYTDRKELASKVDWTLPKKELYASEEYKALKKWQDENATTSQFDGSFVITPKDKWLNPQFNTLNKLREQQSPIAAMYDHLIDLNRRKDRFLPAAAKLYFKLPGITKATRERLGANGIMDTFTEKWKDLTTLRPDDTDYGQLQVLANEANLEKQMIPIHYRVKLSEQDQSFDLTTIALLDFKMATNFKNKIGIMADIDVLKQISETRSVTKRQGFKTKVNKLLKRELSSDNTLTEEGKQSNAHKALNTLIETRMYGIKTLSDPKHDKIANAILRWSGAVALGLNESAAMVNLLQGKLATWLESSSKGLYTKADILKADTKYWADSVGNTADYFKRVATSKTHLLNQLYHVGEHYELHFNFDENSALKRYLNLKGMTQMQESGEHYIQNTLMYSILEAIKPMTSNGMYLDKNFNPTSELKDAISIDEAYVVKEGKLELHPSVATTNKGNMTSFDISRLISKTMKDLNGNYSSHNIAEAQRYALGKMAYFLRKWMPRGFKTRYRGFSTVLKDKSKLDPNLIYFSPELGMEEEGYYTTGIRYLYELRKAFKTLSYQTAKSSWKEMSPRERKNAMKMYREMGLILTAFVLAETLGSMAEGADDDDKAYYYFAAFIARRTYSEMAFYTNPNEFLKIVKSPSAATRTIEDLFEVIGYLLPGGWDNIGDEYIKGKRKGKNKFMKELEDLIPVKNKAGDTYQDKYEYLIQ